MELCNFRGKQNTITEALQIKLSEHAVISITGAGGKTSLMFAWAHELAAGGKRVVITTTTHMRHPSYPSDGIFDPYEGVVAVICSKTDSTISICSAIDKALDENGMVFAASPDLSNSAKVTALPENVMAHVLRTADVVLIEADGSRRKPLKWPAPWEPVVPDYTDITVCVAGLSSLGLNTSDAVYRADEMPDILKRDKVDISLIQALISSREGGQKGVRGDFRVFLNQVDEDADRLAAACRLQQIFAVMGIQSAWGSLKSSAPKIAVILEAAGNSTRFGSNKLLHKMDDGRPMITSVIEAVRKLDVYKKIMVTQYDEAAAMASDFIIIFNDRPDLGISRSMQLGIEAADDSDAYMFCVCDQPGISATTLNKLIEAYKKGTAGIVTLSWKGNMYNPKIFSSRYRDELRNLSGDTGGRQIIAFHRDDISLVEAESEDEVRDIDTLHLI